MHDSIEGISYFENIAAENQKKYVTAQNERLTFLTQLIRYGVCTCHCHFSTSVFHGAEPCCGNAKIKPEL
jgi:hypothetical protein